MTVHIRSLLAVLTALAFLPVAALAGDEGLSPAAEKRKAESFKPTGSVTVKAVTVKVGVGVSWGDGILTFQNENYPFKVSGLSIVGVGGSSIDAEGIVFNLEKLEDFPGTWAEASGAAVLGKESAGGITMRNGNVFMTLAGKQKGAQLSAGGGGLTIRFVDEPAPPKEEE
jgi:hypothetical protein